MTVGPRFGFPLALRLSKQADYQRVFQSAKKSVDTCFTVLARRNDLNHARLGLAISRKVSPKAVVRNRIKRQVRDSFRLNQHRLPNLDIIVLARAQAAQAAGHELRHSLDKHWQRLVRICAQS